MQRKQHNALQIAVPEAGAASGRWVLPILSGAVIHALMGLTGVPNPWLPAAAGVGICCLALWNRTGRWVSTGVLALLVLSALVLRDSFQDGFCQWYNGLGRIWTEEWGMVLPALEASEAYGNLSFFACWLAAALGLGLAALAQWGVEAVCMAAVMVCVGASLSLGRMIEPLPFLAAGAMLAAGRGWKRNGLPALILAAALLASLMPGFAGWAGEQSQSVLRAVHTARYETNYTTLPEGRLEPLAQSDATALIVTMEKPEVLYLRGFTGARFEGDRWLPLDKEIIAENRELLYWLNSREFDLRAQFEAAASGMEAGRNNVIVQNVGACAAYRYLPFTVCADDSLVPEDLTETAAGERYDSFTTVYGGAALLPELLEALTDSTYLRAEAAYREFVEEQYLTVPQELAERMQPYWEKAEGLDAQSAVKAVLESCYPDGVRHDSEYATAAVLTLRHFGIPARYAEGYITPQTTATTVELTGTNAACWAEVYQDGIGWIPMALTPGLEQEPEQQEHPPQDTPEETLPPETEPASEPQPEGGYRVRIGQTVLYGAVIALLLLIFLMLLLVLRRRHILNKRQALFHQEDVREAVTLAFADAVAVLEELGIRRGNGSLENLTGPIAERFGGSFADAFEAASNVNSRALFSGRPMTDEQREVVLCFHSAALALLQANSNRLTRLWMKYIRCRF